MPVIKHVFTAIASNPIATGGSITTEVEPNVTRYYATISEEMIGATNTTMPAANFVDDSDALIQGFPALSNTDYFNIYINGMLQLSSISTLSPTELTINSIDILAGIPIIVEISSFAGATSVMTTQPTISAPTITIIS
ncbi:DUF4183 domain-containing protein [Paenibacillus sp. EC2-1]|uniref:DUF4183 domain-containing protein n=1 Tax=Paenibacillus sp. EC2-1 TaxID=3388665 RepID=UPI003BEF0D84